MSRCFPYPPPNYRREEKSLAESIKLQKERETANESRKEKKKEKREKRDKRDKREKSKDKHKHSKHREHGHKKRKYDERNELQRDAATKDAIEQLEKSGLTEEHRLPFPMQEPCESSESTQNSSKSRKLEAPNVSGGSHGSTILRLKLSSHKYKDPKPTPVTDEPCFSGRATSKDLEAVPANEEPCFSGQATPKDLKATPAIRPTPKDLKATQAKRPPSKDLKATPAIRPIPKDLKATQAKRPPSKDLKANPSIRATKDLQETPAIGATSEDLKVTPAIRATLKDLKTTLAIRATTEDLKTTPANEKPCFSSRDTSKCREATPANERPSSFPGRTTEAPMEMELGHNSHSQSINSSKKPEAPMEQYLGDHGRNHSSSRTKKSSKRSREERQFKDLVVNWKPAPLLLDAEAGTEDMGWLSESSRQHHVSSDVESCSVSSVGAHLSAAGSFQPRACYLPELEMFQLPYVVPF